MSDILSASIEKLRKSSSTLNQLSDTTNINVGYIEDALREQFKIGTSASVSAGDDPEYDDGEIFLAYRKIGSKFRIAVIHAFPGDEDHEKPWSDCSRELKIRTIKYLPLLITELTKKIDAQIKDAELANNTAAFVLATTISPGE